MKDLEYEKGIPITYIADNPVRESNKLRESWTFRIFATENKLSERPGHVDSQWHSYQSSFSNVTLKTIQIEKDMTKDIGNNSIKKPRTRRIIMKWSITAHFIVQSDQSSTGHKLRQ